MRDGEPVGEHSVTLAQTCGVSPWRALLRSRACVRDGLELAELADATQRQYVSVVIDSLR